MNINDIDKIKGFMPKHEGNALFNWATNFSNIGPILEVGTYCGKSTLYLSKGASVNGQLVFTIDHHYGSEEHQLNEEYYDKEIYNLLSPKTLLCLLKKIENLLENYSSLNNEPWQNQLL